MLKQLADVEVVLVNKNKREMRTQDYKIELIVKTDVESNPREWLKNAKKYGGFPFGESLLAGTAPNIIKVYSTSVDPIDSGNPEYKYMQDME